MRLGGWIFGDERHFHINYKTICIKYCLPIKGKDSNLAVKVLRCLIFSFYIHHIFPITVFNHVTAHLKSLAPVEPTRSVSLVESRGRRLFGNQFLVYFGTQCYFFFYCSEQQWTTVMSKQNTKKMTTIRCQTTQPTKDQTQTSSRKSIREPGIHEVSTIYLALFWSSSHSSLKQTNKQANKHTLFFSWSYCSSSSYKS